MVIIKKVDNHLSIFQAILLLLKSVIVKLRSRSRSGEGQVRVRKVKVRLGPAPRTLNSKTWT